MLCFIDYRTDIYERETLENHGFNCISIPKYKDLYPAIDGHVDIQLNILNKTTKEVIIHKNMDENFKSILSNNNISFIETTSSLSSSYPGDIIINSLILKDYFVHNLKFTDKNLLKSQSNKILIDVKQGYTKCSCLPISEKALITNDIGISKSLTRHGFDILLLPPGDISLPGVNYGFIGGTGGMISEDILALFGDLKYYAYGKEFKDFLFKHNVKPLYLSNGRLNDRGSLFVL